MAPVDDFEYNDTDTSFLGGESDMNILWRGNHGKIAEVFINVVVWSICSLTIIGNALIIAVFVVDGKVRGKVSNLYILNLAICDFLIGSISLVLHNIYRYYGVWNYGKPLCMIYLVVDWTATIVSVWAIVLISYDRYVLVTKGLAYDKIQTRRKFCYLGGSIWVIYVLRYGIVIIGYDFWFESWVDYTRTCATAADYVSSIVIFNAITSLCLPVLLIVVFNVVVFINIRKRTKGLPRNRASSQVSPEETTEDTADPPAPASSSNQDQAAPATSSNQDQGSREQRRRQEGTSDVSKLRRSAVTLALIVGTSALCWLPYYIYITASILHITVNTTVAIATYYIWWSSSLWNPILFVATNPGIRRGVLKIFRFHR